MAEHQLSSLGTVSLLDLIHCLIEINDARILFALRTRSEHAKMNEARQRCMEHGWVDAWGAITPAGQELLKRLEATCIHVISKGIAMGSSPSMHQMEA